MDDAKPAARVADPVGHSLAMSGLLIGVVAGVALGVATVATGGLAGVAAAAIIAGSAAGGGLAGGYIGAAFQGAPTGAIIVGSPDILIDGRPATMAVLGIGTCAKEYGVPQPVASGAATVLFNGFPAARVGDPLACSAVILSGSETVLIGGAGVQVLPTTPEIPAWLTTTLTVVAVAAGVIGFGAAVATVGAGVALAGAGGALVGGGLLSLGGRALGEYLGLEEGYTRMLEVGGGLVGSIAGGAAAARGALYAMRNWRPTTAAGVIFRQGWVNEAPGVVADRNAITRLSEQGRIDAARDLLRPYVDAGDIDGIVNRLDLSAPRDKGYLWSGDKAAAMQYAADRGGVTLEQTPGGRVIDDWAYLNSKLPWEAGGERLWGQASGQYASQLSGQVTALQTPDKLGGGYVYRNYELPQINQGLLNGSITGHDVIVLPAPR